MSLKEEATVSGWTMLLRWFDRYHGNDDDSEQGASGVDWGRIIPFTGMHLGVLAVFWVGWSPVAVGTTIFLYALRMFAIPGVYHRYFSHKSFSTSRTLQIIFGVIGASSVQRDLLGWAANHRLHHIHTVTPEDVHSPLQHSFLWSHMGWFLFRRNFRTRFDKIRDFARFPELRFIDRYDVVVPTLFAISMFLYGELLKYVAPGLGTNGWQMLVWGFVISTVVLYHMTFTITSLAHVIGHRRYDTTDTSRNHFILALITFGEGWHNNHHFYPSSVRQGFRWWELDLTYYILLVLQMLGLIWDVRPVPARVLKANPTGPLTDPQRSKAR